MMHNQRNIKFLLLLITKLVYEMCNEVQPKYNCVTYN